jgi:hypothetical protein
MICFPSGSNPGKVMGAEPVAKIIFLLPIELVLPSSAEISISVFDFSLPNP